MTERVYAMVSLLLPLLAVTVSGCTTNGPAETAMRDDEGEIRYVRNSEFSGPRLRMFLTLKDGSRASVDTADDAVQTRPGVTPVPGHRARDWTFVKDVKAGTTVAHALVSWDPDDPDDYLMAGWVDTVPGSAFSRAGPRGVRPIRDRRRAGDRSRESAGAARDRGGDLHRQCRRGLCLRSGGATRTPP